MARGLPPDVVEQVRVRAGEGIAGWVLARGRPRILRRGERALDAHAHRDRLPAAISAPLRVRQRTIGVLNISESVAGDFTPADVRVLMAFAGQAAAAIENARLCESLRLKMGKLEAIHRIGQALTSSLSLPRVVRQVLKRATETLGAGRGSIMLLSPDAQELRMAWAIGIDRDLWREVRLPLGHGIAGVVAQTQMSVILDDGTVDVRSASGEGIEHRHAAMCVPLRLRGRAIGVLSISHPVAGGNFHAEDLRFLTTLADQAAIAIENARLYRRLQQRVNLANRELIRANHRLEQEKENLAHEKQKIQAILDGMADGVVVVDRLNRVTLLNPAAEAMLAIPAAEALRKSLKHWPAGQALLAVLEDARQSDGMNVVKEIPVPRGKDRLVLSANISPLRDAQSRTSGFIAVLTDVTPLRELSDMKSELVSFVSHELRTPLTAIRGFAEILRSPTHKPDANLLHEALDIICNESDRILGMINEMLDVSRMESGRSLDLFREPVEMPALLQRAIAAQRACTARHQFALDLAPDLPPADADADKVYQVVTNLLTNAVKYSPEGGTITVAAGRRDGRLRVSVAGQGLGIPPEMIGKLFQRHYRVETKAHSSIKGTGLGLFFVKGVVEAHGGSVWVESQYGKGSRFTFEIPVSADPVSGNDESGGERR